MIMESWLYPRTSLSPPVTEPAYANVSTQSRSRSGADHGALAGVQQVHRVVGATEARGEQAGTRALFHRERKLHSRVVLE
jgi:hypothetical protein